MSQSETPTFVRERIAALNHNERVTLLQHATDVLIKRLDTHFEWRASRGFEGEGEQIEFGGITLDINDSPPIAIVDFDFNILVSSRLELHLYDYEGMERSRVALGQIARYIAREDLLKDYSILAVTTYAGMARLVQKALGMTYSLATYVPASAEADETAQGIAEAATEFALNNGLELALPIELTSLTMPTQEFVNRWVNYPDDPVSPSKQESLVPLSIDLPEHSREQ